jgi:hypothetical protein
MLKRMSMTAFMLLLALGLAVTRQAGATTLYVNCDAREGLTSVNSAIKLLASRGSEGANVINVRGACNENVVIQGMTRLTLDGGNSARIVDLTGGATAAILIDSSQEITINNLTASGTSQGSGDWDVIDCVNGSICRLNNVTVQNGSLGAGGIGVWNGSFMSVVGGVAQNNKGWGGIIAGYGGRAHVSGMASRGNWAGAVSYQSAFLQLISVSLTDNDGEGIDVANGGNVLCTDCTISGNGTARAGDGINVRQSSNVSLAGQTNVTGNGGAGVRLTKLSSLVIPSGTPNVTGNLGGTDVVCSPSYTTVTLNDAHVGTISGCP